MNQINLTKSTTTATTIVLLVTLIVAVNQIKCYSDTDFLQSISKQFNPALIERHFKETIKSRIATINSIRNDFNPTVEQIALCNVTLSTLIMFTDYIDLSIPSFQTCGFSASHKLKSFIDQYETIIDLWRQEFKSTELTNQLIETEFKTPQELIYDLKNSGLTRDPDRLNQIKLQALQSIERYRFNVKLIYQEVSRYESTLADSTIKQLNLLENEMRQLNVNPAHTETKTGPLNIPSQHQSLRSISKAFRILLERFNLIIKLFTCSSVSGD